MKIVTVVGARPQFIKAAVVSRCIRKKHTEVLIHTGQHYDENMSDIFFDELDIPRPDYNLGITAKTHGEMTGLMLIEIEKVLLKEKPDMLLVYGDTNSTIAASLAAVKLHIPVCHVESGARAGALVNPEETNRIVTDHVSTLLLCCTQSAVDFLKKEGKTENVYLVGDPMFDAFCYYSAKADSQGDHELISLSGETLEIPSRYYYMTCHREENTSDEKLLEVLSAMNALDFPTVFPVHPRNNEKILELNKNNAFENIIFCSPVGYLTSVYLTNHAEKIVTDSGGLQREAYFAKKQCLTMLDYVPWPETMNNNWNALVAPRTEEIIAALNKDVTGNQIEGQFGSGDAGDKIADIISSFEEI